MKTTYEFVHTLIREVPASAKVVFWNFLDFVHPKYVHKRTFHHCKVLAHSGDVHLMEYGVYHFGRHLPFVKKYVMWHHFTPPDTLRHISAGPFGGYNRVHIKVTENNQGEGANLSRNTKIEHTFNVQLPILFKPFEKLIEKYMDHWSNVLWEEDLSIILRRQKVLDLGFKDLAGAPSLSLPPSE